MKILSLILSILLLAAHPLQAAVCVGFGQSVSCSGNYGNTTGTQSVSSSNLAIWVVQVAACNGGSISSITAMVGSANASGRRVMPVIYSDSAGEPDALLYVGSPVWNSGWSTAADQVLASGLSVSTTTANLWIGLVIELGGTTSWVRDSSLTDDMRYTTVAAMTTGDVPTTWPTSTDSTSTHKMRIYVTY